MSGFEGNCAYVRFIVNQSPSRQKRKIGYTRKRNGPHCAYHYDTKSARLMRVFSKI